MTSPQDPAVSNARAIGAFSIGALFFAFAFFHRVAPSVMTSEWMRDFAVGAAELGILSGWYFYAYAAIQLPVGMLNDRFGPRKLMSAAVAVCALASFGFAASESVLAASFFRAMIGATVAFAFVGTLTIIAYWFSAKRFTMLAGAVQSLGMCGAVLAQGPLRYAVEHFGWRATIGAMGVMAVVLAVSLFYIVPRRPRAAVPAGPPPGVFSGVVSVISRPQSWICAGIGFGMTAIMLAFSGLWAVPWLHSVHGYAETHAAWMASLLFIGWAVGAPFMGWLSDHLGKRRPVLLGGILCNTAIFAVLLLSGVSGVGVFAVLFFSLGVSGSMMTVSFGAMREVNSPQHSATAMGLLNMCVVGSGAVMQPVIGWLLDIGWDGQLLDDVRVYSASAYRIALSTLIGSNLLALVCILLLRETYCRPLEALSEAPHDSAAANPPK